MEIVQSRLIFIFEQQFRMIKFSLSLSAATGTTASDVDIIILYYV